MGSGAEGDGRLSPLGLLAIARTDRIVPRMAREGERDGGVRVDAVHHSLRGCDSRSLIRNIVDADSILVGNSGGERATLSDEETTIR